jgi:uncharacterized protein YndB with AHSA1/START domain
MDAMTAKASPSADREIVITRLIDAPPARVFDAWTNPEQVVQWWGPRGFTTTTHKMEVKSGGVWRFVMHGPDGRDYQNKITYLEVVRPERLVYRHGGDEDLEPVSFQTTVTFEPQVKKTVVTLRAVFPTAAERDRVVKEYGAIEGGKQTLERLDEHLAGAGLGTSRAFVISRVFDAPRDVVWKAHSELDALKQWWGPRASPGSLARSISAQAACSSTACVRQAVRRCGAGSSIARSSSLSAWCTSCLSPIRRAA